MFWMPSMMTTTMLLVVTLLTLVYVGFVLREKGADERDVLHRMLAGRAAYLTGVGMLTLALLVQGFMYHIDPWVPGTLALMIVAKVGTRLWAERAR
jgi:hypothetical protein